MKTKRTTPCRVRTTLLQHAARHADEIETSTTPADNDKRLEITRFFFVFVFLRFSLCRRCPPIVFFSNLKFNFSSFYSRAQSQHEKTTAVADFSTKHNLISTTTTLCCSFYQSHIFRRRHSLYYTIRIRNPKIE